VLPIIAQIRKAGAATLRAIGDAFNARGVPTPRGGRWHATTVRNALLERELFGPRAFSNQQISWRPVNSPPHGSIQPRSRPWAGY
jgi:hypothetical protein